MKLSKEWSEVIPDYWEYKKDTWLGTPIESNKFLLVSWRMSGSEFCKELIRENYPETTLLTQWAKSHTVLDNQISDDLINNAKTKVFMIITDPREVTMNLAHFDNGIHGYEHDYTSGTRAAYDSVKFLNEVANKQIKLIDYYTKKFGKNCIVLRYEDAFHYQDDFHEKVSNFLGIDPLGIDDVRKYKWSIYKNVGEFFNFFKNETLDEHYISYKWFYDKWNYPIGGLANKKYNWNMNHPDVTGRQKTENYVDMLKRNGISQSNRTNHLDEF